MSESEPEDLFGSKQISIGKTTYTLRELKGSVYDKCVELATTDKGTDTQALLKFMLERSIDPAMSLGELGDLPMTKRRDLISAVSDLHFGTPPTDEAGKAASG